MPIEIVRDLPAETKLSSRTIVVALAWLASTAGLTIFLVRYLPQFQILSVGERAVWSFLLVLVALGMVAWSIKKVRLSSRLIWEALFIAALFLGVWFALRLLVPGSMSIIVAALGVILPFFFPQLWLQAAFFLIGTAGAATLLGLRLPPAGIFVLLVGFTFYDLIGTSARDKVRHFSDSLTRRNVVTGLRLSVSESGLFIPVGDVLLPLLVVARASLWGAWIGGAIVGGFLLGAYYGLTRPVPKLVPWAGLGAVIAASILQVVGWSV